MENKSEKIIIMPARIDEKPSNIYLTTPHRGDDDLTQRFGCPRQFGNNNIDMTPQKFQGKPAILTSKLLLEKKTISKTFYTCLLIANEIKDNCE